jgi:PKD repeat protein
MMPDGSLVVTGQANRGFLDWYTVAFETTGAVRWEAVRDGGLNTDEIPAAVLVLANGTTVVTGRGGPNLPGGFIPGVTVGYSSNGTLLWEAFSNLATVWATALPNGDVCATGGYDALITCWQVSGGVVTTPSPTPGPTTTPTNTPPPPTPTATPAGSINTGFISPSANAPQTTSAGDKNGYESSPGNAYTNDSLVATDTNSGTNTSTSCTNSGKDRHHFFNFNFNIPTTAVIQGIQVRLDARADATAGSPNICVEMSWDGGTTWTLAKSTTTLSTSEATYILGSVSDTWGRTWNSSDFSNVNFRLRVTDVASNTRRDFFLDYVAANVTYTVGDAPVNQSPTAVVSADVTSGASPLAVNFTGSASSDPDGTIASYAWNFGDGNSTTGATAFNTYTTAGTYVATLTVTDNEGATASDTVTIVVTDPAAGCSSNCARVSNISLAVRGNGMLAATVTVVNENGAALVGAVVSATWTLPNGATSSATGTVSNRGTALFNLGDNGPGTYTLTVTNVSQSGYTFDAPNSILSGNVVK